jgi:hypothetical protein
MSRRKTVVSRDKREHIVALRQRGHSWLSIQQEMGIDRRVVKRVFEEWQRGDESADVARARIALIKDELSQHIDMLMRLAVDIMETLGPPALEEERNSNEVIDVALRRMDSDALHRAESAVSRYSRSPEGKPLSRKRTLLTSLEQHLTATPAWRCLRDYMEARDEWLAQREQLDYHIGHVMVGCSQHDSELPEDLYERQRLVRRLGAGYLGLVLESMKTDKAGKMAHRDTNLLKQVSFDVDADIVFVEFGGTGLRVAVKITGDADSTISSIRDLLQCADNALPNVARGGVMTYARAALTSLLQAHDKLAKQFDPTKLRLSLLHTKCDLCR